MFSADKVLLSDLVLLYELCVNLRSSASAVFVVVVIFMWNRRPECFIIYLLLLFCLPKVIYASVSFHCMVKVFTVVKLSHVCLCAHVCVNEQIEDRDTCIYLGNTKITMKST